MRVAILGWGSLLWDRRADFVEFNDRYRDWQLDGPTLKIEFSRVSYSRRGALTLVIDEQHGAPTTVAWCPSNRDALADVVRDLGCREGTTEKRIGRVYAGQAHAFAPGTVEHSILAWAEGKQLDAVVWTALDSNFHEHTKRTFSVEAAVEYVGGLEREARVKAVEYVARAPDFVRTPVRAALQRVQWFREIEVRQAPH